DELAAISSALDDLLDGHTLLRQFLNSLVRFLTAQISFVLQPLGIGEKLWIDDGAANGLSDLPHGFADSVQKGAAGIFHQMPAVSHLSGMRQRPGHRLAIAAT